MVATLPTTGKGDWANFIDYWRDEDITWLQDRVILRYADNSERDTNLGSSPAAGQVVYNTQLGILQLRHGTAWKNYTPLPANLMVYSDTTAIAGIGHVGAGSKGITFRSTPTPSQVEVTDNFNVLGGVLHVSSTGVAVKTGTKTAKLTTSATHLVSDTPLSASELALTGTGTVISAGGAGRTATLGATTVSSLISTGTVAASGAVTAPSGTIGNVKFQNNEIIVPVNQGMRSGEGWFYGGANSAVMRHTTDGVSGSPNYVQVDANSVQIAGDSGTFNVYPLMRIYGANPIQYYGGSGVFRGNIAPTIYDATGSPDPAYYPEGTIWVS